MGIYKLPKNQWTKDGRKYKYYWNEKDKSGKWKKKFSQAYKTKLDAMNAEREFLNNKIEFGGDMDMTFGTLTDQYIESQKNKVRRRTMETYLKRRKYFTSFENVKLKDMDGNLYHKFQQELWDKPIKCSSRNDIQKFLKIIQHSKKFQKKLNISFDDYAQLYISFELEITLCDDKYGSFIKINDYEKKYYHIYFDDKKEEIQRDYLDKEDKVNKIKIIVDKQAEILKKLFYNCTCIKTINFKHFYITNIANMSEMFYGCSSLKELDLTNFKTNNANDMSYMFYGCSSLIELNLTNFKTNNVNDMSNMFSGCTSLKELNLTNFNTDNVYDMSEMFSGCTSLKELNLTNFNTNNVNNMSYMFSGCTSLIKLNLTSFKTDSVEDMSWMFNWCSSLKELNLTNFNTNNVNDMSYMFSNCSSLKELNLTNFSTNNVINKSHMFDGCPSEIRKKISEI